MRYSPDFVAILPAFFAGAPEGVLFNVGDRGRDRCGGFVAVAVLFAAPLVGRPFEISVAVVIVFGSQAQNRAVGVAAAVVMAMPMV